MNALDSKFGEFNRKLEEVLIKKSKWTVAK